MENFKIGIQLYTLREQLNDDFLGCLKKLAAMGYDGVEFAMMYGGLNPKELAKALNEIGLEVCGMHVGLNHIMDKDSDAYRYAKAIGCKYLVVSLPGTFINEFDKVLRDCIEAGRVAAEQGLNFVYHNHAQEFERVNGRCALDIFYEQSPASQVKAEFDTYWVKKGGEDPVPYLKKYADRLPLIHLKDMNRTNGGFAVIGSGLIDVPGVIGVARESVAEWVIYEQDSCSSAPLECARASIKNIRKYVK